MKKRKDARPVRRRVTSEASFEIGKGEDKMEGWQKRYLLITKKSGQKAVVQECTTVEEAEFKVPKGEKRCWYMVIDLHWRNVVLIGTTDGTVVAEVSDISSVSGSSFQLSPAETPHFLLVNALRLERENLIELIVNLVARLSERDFAEVVKKVKAMQQ